MQDDFSTLETPAADKIKTMIVDKSGRVIALSSSLKGIITSIKAHTSFLEHFKTEESALLSKLFNAPISSKCLTLAETSLSCGRPFRNASSKDVLCSSVNAARIPVLGLSKRFVITLFVNFKRGYQPNLTDLFCQYRLDFF